MKIPCRLNKDGHNTSQASTVPHMLTGLLPFCDRPYSHCMVGRGRSVAFREAKSLLQVAQLICNVAGSSSDYQGVVNTGGTHKRETHTLPLWSVGCPL